MESRIFKPYDINKTKELFEYEMTDVILNLKGEFAAVCGERFENFIYDKDIPQVNVADIPPVETKTSTVDINVDTTVDVGNIPNINFKPKKNDKLECICRKTELNISDNKKIKFNVSTEFPFKERVPEFSLNSTGICVLDTENLKYKHINVSLPSIQQHFKTQPVQNIMVKKYSLSNNLESRTKVAFDYNIVKVEISKRKIIGIPKTTTINMNNIFESYHFERIRIDIPKVEKVKEKYNFTTETINNNIKYKPIKKIDLKYSGCVNSYLEFETEIPDITEMKINTEETVKYILSNS